ncbi:DUF1433 domain-containing protein [Macrococcus armenti]|uniref:DUF1433 domain-containing protein n=1 Tax=Macrococcus armenti TaxID=2875764 RepID=UPI001CCF5CA5|nr:DUF1433 domain-containing protein [Macrococcus armenti]UBH16556.1 DUF1433 domain-containing protein [Macrococcus armenti]UBH18918.1 DUF1433 domain-containing protein [Macrococcus armenti]UBH21187.1 DUF1433 domain-containing protein [Macrococcus armenti]
MVSKKILIIFTIIMSLCLIIGGVYFKMKNDAQEKEAELYYKEQQERITLYLKYNTKEQNTIKSVKFTNVSTTPMGSYVFEGYINDNKNNDFVAYSTPEKNYEFDGNMSVDEKILNLLKPAHELKSPEKIKQELSKEK